MDAAFEYVFPAIRGIQARREYYVSMCPLRLLPKIFLFNEEELVPELRAQRTLNKNRIPEIARYISDNPDSYVFSAITASVDADVRFEPLASGAEGQRVGQLHIPMSARFIINDGQHRRAAIEAALRETPDLADESIAVVFFLDIGLARCQQMFADLNRYAIRPSKSVGVLYDHRDASAKLAKSIVLRCPAFKDMVETERSTLSIRSRKLFTLSSIYFATAAFFNHAPDESVDNRVAKAVAFWDEVAKQFPEWQLVRERKITAGEVRRDFIHSHGIALQSHLPGWRLPDGFGRHQLEAAAQATQKHQLVAFQREALGGTRHDRGADFQGKSQRGADDQRDQDVSRLATIS